MSVTIGGIEAYLNQLQYGNAGQAAKSLHQQIKTESIAAEAMGTTPKADRKDGFSSLSAAESNATFLKKDPVQQENVRVDALELIRERLGRGEQLSDSDMRYLRSSDPALYQKAKQVQELRNKFNDILRRAPRANGEKIYQEVIAQAKKVQTSGEPETGRFLVQAIEKDYADYRALSLAESRISK